MISVMLLNAVDYLMVIPQQLFFGSRKEQLMVTKRFT